MAQNGAEPLEIVDLGSGASPRDVERFRQGWQAATRASRENPVKIGGRAFIPQDQYPCGAVLGVALAWFAAGLLIGLALLVVIIT